MKSTAKPTLEQALAAAIAGRLTDGTIAALDRRALAYQAALEGFQMGVATSAQLIAEMAVDGDAGVLRDAERQVRALPGEQV